MRSRAYTPLVLLALAVSAGCGSMIETVNRFGSPVLSPQDSWEQAQAETVTDVVDDDPTLHSEPSDEFDLDSLWRVDEASLDGDFGVRETEFVAQPSDERDAEREQNGATADNFQSLLVPPSLPAEAPSNTTSSSAGPLTDAYRFDDLVQMALTHNPTLRQAGALVDEAEGDWLQVGLYPNPTLGWLGEEMGDKDTAGRQGIFASQQFVRGGKLERNRDVAAWTIEQRRWQADAQRLAVLTDLRIATYELLAAQAATDIVTELEEIVSQGVETTEQLLEAGEVPETDVLQAEIELDSVRLLGTQTTLRSAAAAREVAAIVGRPELASLTLAETLPSSAPELHPEAELQRILSESPVLEAARAEVAEAHAHVARAQVEPIPDVTGQIGLSRDTLEHQFLATASLSIPLPVWDKNQGNILAANAAVVARVRNVERIELAIRREFASVFNRYQDAAARIERIRSELLPKAERALELTREGYAAGEVDFLRVLTAQRSFVEQRIRLLAARADLAAALAELEGLLVTGGLSAPTQVTQQVRGSESRPSGVPALAR